MDTKMNFGQAIDAMRDGRRVARSDWQGQPSFVVLMPSLSLPAFSSQEPGAKVNDRTAKHIGVDTPLDSRPYFASFTTPHPGAGVWQPGWLPSAADILANDWKVIGA